MCKDMDSKAMLPPVYAQYTLSSLWVYNHKSSKKLQGREELLILILKIISYVILNTSFSPYLFYTTKDMASVFISKSLKEALQKV